MQTHQVEKVEKDASNSAYPGIGRSRRAMRSQCLRGSLLAAISGLALTCGFAPAARAQVAATSTADPELAAKGQWDKTVTYAKDDIVTARGSSWISLKAGNKGKIPGQTDPSTAAWWRLFARGFNPVGAWANSTTYQPDDLVTRGGQTYRAKVTNTNLLPPSAAIWELLAAKGVQGLRGPQGPAGPNTGIAAGTTSAPAISFSDDPDTGIYQPSANKIALVEGGKVFLHNIGAQNTALGLNALGTNTTGRDNTAVGTLALFSNTTGSQNAAAGLGALFSNTAGTYNTAMGPFALYYNTTGNNNTAVGGNALGTNKTGNSNTAVGDTALGNNTTGYYNAALGATALQQNTTGYYNTALGFQALFTNTTGFYNTAVGPNALYKNTTGDTNSALGLNALFANTTGYENTAVGVDALFANTTGWRNTAVGRDALSKNTTGTTNAALGYGALQNTTSNNNAALGYQALGSNTTGFANIAIGTNAGYNATAPQNSIFIGNNGAGGDTNTIKIGTKGTQTSTYIAGITSASIDGADPDTSAVGIRVSTGQLGLYIESSSRRYKDDIHAMPDMSALLTKLRPVTFRYKKPFADGTHPLQYGLIAEEVAEVFPRLAVFNKNGQPETVKYHKLPIFLLAGYQAQQKTIAAQAHTIETLTKSDREQADRIAVLERRLAALDAALPHSTKAALR